VLVRYANRSQLFSSHKHPVPTSLLDSRQPRRERAYSSTLLIARARRSFRELSRELSREPSPISRFFVVIMHAKNLKRSGSPSGRRRLAVPQRGSRGAADGCTLTAIRERVYSQTFLHATLTTIKRNTQGRSAGGLCSAKAPPAKSAGLRCMHEKRQPLRGTYLPLCLPVRPSVRPFLSYVRLPVRMQRVPGLAFSRTRGAPFGYMLMPAAFRDAIQFSSLTPADLRGRCLRVKVRESARRRRGRSSRRAGTVVKTIDPSHRRPAKRKFL